MTRVLIVDDEPIQRAVTEMSLKSRGFETISVSRGDEALEHAIKNTPDVVLLDVMMPELNGIEVCRRIKALSNRFIPIIMVTGKDSVEDKVRGLNNGADDYLTKPINFPEVTARIESMIRIKTHQDKLQDMTIHDAQTGLYNKRHAKALMKEELARVKRTKSPLSCFTIDLDDFKIVNELYGHNFGDAIMDQVAKLIEGINRPEDTLSRIGDDEFLVLMRNTTTAEAVVVAEHLRLTLKKHQFIEDLETIRLTCSIGIGTFHEAMETDTENAMARLDEAIRRAKKQGGNQVSIHRWDPDI